MRLSKLVATLAAVAASGCANTVQLKVGNPTADPYEVKVELRDSDGRPKSSISLGRLDPGKEEARTFKAKPDSVVAMSAQTVSKKYVVWEESKTVPRKPKPFPIDSSISVSPGSRIPTEPNVKDIANRLGGLGPDLGFAPLPVRNALKTMFGAVKVVELKDGRISKELLTLQPAQLGNETAYEAFDYPDHTTEFKVEVLGSSAANLTLSLPVFGVGLAWDTNSAYRLTSTLRGFGTVDKVVAKDFALEKAITPDHQKAIAAVLKEHKDAVLLYVNKMWVVKDGDVDVYEGKSFANGEKLNVPAVFNGDTAFKFSDSKSGNRHFSEQALEFWGEEYVPEFVTAVETVSVAPSGGGTKTKIEGLHQIDLAVNTVDADTLKGISKVYTGKTTVTQQTTLRLTPTNRPVLVPKELVKAE